MTEESTKIKCILCSDLVQRKHLSDHIRGHTREKPYFCKDCNSTFPSKGSLYQHSKRMHNSDSKDMALPKPKLKCVYCGCEFRNEYYLSWHRRQRIGNHPYECRYCCASFVDEVKLRRHHDSIHKGRIFIVKRPDVRVAGNSLPDSDSDAESIEAPTPATDTEVDKQPELPSTSRRMENNEFSPSVEALTPTEVDKQSEVQSTSSRMDYNEFLSGRTRIRKPSAVNTFNFSRELFPRRRLNLESTPEPTASPLAGVLNTNVNTDDDIQKMKEDNDYEAEMDVEDIAALNIKMMKDEGHEAEEGAAGNFKKQYCNNKVEDFEDSFVLSVWRTSKEANYLNLYGQSPASDKALSYTLNFLRGGTDTSQLSVNELLSLVTQSAVKLVGLFPAALMIIDFAVNKDIQCLVTLYEECSKLDVKLQRIVKTIITLFVQRQFVDGNTELNKLSELPQSIQDLFRVHLMIELKYLRESNTNSELLQSTPNAQQTFSAIMEMLEELVDEDMKNEHQNLQLADTSYSWNERGFIWIRNIRKYVHGILDNDHQPFFNVALRKEMEIERRRGIGENFVLVANTRHNDVTDVFTPLYVHKQVIRRFGEPPSKDEVEALVIASDEEVDTFLSLLYDSFKPSKYKGKITLAVFQLACKIKVRDNWYFMFRDSNFLDLTDDRNRQSILDILLLVKKYPELDNLARNFTLLFSGEKATKCLNDMHPTLVKSFLDMTTLRVDELLVYKIMMQWSHFEARKPCEDEMKATYDPDVDVEFKRVRSALRLTELTRHFGSICRQDGYITWEDAELAHKFNINKMSAEDVWFSVKPRERPE